MEFTAAALIQILVTLCSIVGGAFIIGSKLGGLEQTLKDFHTRLEKIEPHHILIPSLEQRLNRVEEDLRALLKAAREVVSRKGAQK